ncbi:Regulation of nuclear pre-mRNA domain-containing protein 1B [Cyberlindnera fabianii]|uniref:Regulation of nuclear pre-mRNA domain-containing protein 1B n=1 Tax=Cyberlindnera fabianii TaxID=36022 RepID=A0A1V2L9Z4_CYBFA|nr:Regulation of nuclear pre-mRNA domain-containing protein 1B [Cyberlindnera fabianii]
MSYSNESFISKLNALQETQESIVSTSTWVLFHYRYADRIASEWEKYLYQAPPPRKLAVIYLANEVVQQARARKRTEFIDAFYKVLPGSLGNAYKKVPPQIQPKIAKLVNVLVDRKIFPGPLNVPGISSDSGHQSVAHASVGSDDEKLRGLASSGQKFHKFYHEMLLKANGSFTDSQLPYLQRLKVMLAENIGQLQDLQSTVDEEIEKTAERSKAAREKLEELKKKQQEIEMQKHLDEMKRQEEARKQAEEDKILPTYAESDDDSDSDSDSDSESGSDNDEEKKETEKSTTDDSSETKKDKTEETNPEADDEEYSPEEATATPTPTAPDTTTETMTETTDSQASEPPKKKKKVLRFA